MSIAIIGCGVTGSVLAEQLSKSGHVSEIKILDKDPKKSEKVVKVLEEKYDKDYTAETVDATDTKSVKNKLSKAKVVINSASPTCNIPIMKACLNSDTNYIDLASDPFEYPEQKGTSFNSQLKLNEDFIESDLLAVSNTGFAPGFTDIFSKYFIENKCLDTVNHIKIYLGEKIISDKFVISWSPYVFLMESLLRPTIYSDGKVETLTHKERNYRNINFSSSIGNIKLKIFNGHPELKTIPMYVDQPIDHIEIAGGYKLNDMGFNEILVKAFEKQIAKSRFLEGDIFQNLSSSFESPSNFRKLFRENEIENELSEFVISIKGKRDGEIFEKKIRSKHTLEEISKEVSLGTVSSYLVSFVPTIIAERILKSKTTKKGVTAAVGINNLGEIVEECKDRGLLKD